MSQEELLSIPDLDGVLIETEMSELIDTANKCLARKLPVHIDKPGGSEEFDRYVELVNNYHNAGLTFQVAYMFRGTNGFIEINPIEQTYDPELRYPIFDDKPLEVVMEIGKDTPEYKAGRHIIPCHTTGRYDDQLAEFAATLRGECTNRYSAQYEITLQKLVLAASGYIKW